MSESKEESTLEGDCESDVDCESESEFECDLECRERMEDGVDDDRDENSRGYVVAFESCGGTGRTSLVYGVKKELEKKFDRQCYVATFPDYSTELGALIGGELERIHPENASRTQAQKVFLMRVANLKEGIERIDKEVSNGNIVLCDGFVVSCLAYSLALASVRYGEDDATWFLDCLKKIPIPRVVVFLDNCSQGGTPKFVSPRSSKAQLSAGVDAGASASSTGDHLDLEAKAYENFKVMEGGDYASESGEWVPISCCEPDDTTSSMVDRVLPIFFEMGL